MWRSGSEELSFQGDSVITEDCYIPGMLLDGTNCNVLLDMGTSKSLISKTLF